MKIGNIDLIVLLTFDDSVAEVCLYRKQRREREGERDSRRLDHR